MSYTQPQPALPMLAGNWWALLLRGIVTVLFGLAALLWPGLTLFVLIVFFGAYALVDGILAIVAGIRGSEGSRWLLLAEGVLGVLAGHDGIGTAVRDLGLGDLHGPPEGSYGHCVQAEDRERVASGAEWCALCSLRGRPRAFARGRAALFGVARRDLRADLRRRTDRAGLPCSGPPSSERQQGYIEEAERRKRR